MEISNKLFIFDLGEVVLRNIKTLPMIAEHYNLDYTEFRKDYALYDKPLMEGFMKSEDYYRHIEIEYSLDKIDEDLFSLYFNPYPNTYMLNTVDKLRKKGHKAVIGSNTFKPHWDYVLKMKDEPLSHFDSLYPSHLIHIAKPSLAFWNYIIREEGFSAKDTIFIDDREDNINAASSLGLTTFKYDWDDRKAEEFFKAYL